MKRLILPKTWTKIDVDSHHFDYSSRSSLLCVSLLHDSKIIYLKKIIFFKIFWKYKINRYYYVMQLNLFWHYLHGNYIFNSWSVSNAKEIMTNTTYMYFINFFKSLYQCFFFQFKYLYSQNLINKISSLVLLSKWWCHS
jgi:hypothetical protein